MAHEKRLLIDVFQAYFYRKKPNGNRELVFMSENLTSGGIVTSQENTDVRNGQGNTLFAVLPGAKDVTVNLTENVFSFEALKINSAGVESAGAATANTGLILKKPNRYGDMTVTPNQQVGGQNNKTKIKLPGVPENVKELEVYIDGVLFEYTDQANQVTNQKFTVAKESGAIEDGTALATESVYLVVADDQATDMETKKTLKIMPYVCKTVAAKTKTLTIDSRQFSEGGELWLQTIEKDEKQKATAYVYFVFDNAMPEGNFEINTVSEVQPNDMTVNMRILANESGELYRIIREEI